MARKANTPTEAKADKTIGPVKLAPPLEKRLRDAARCIVANAIRRQPELQEISGQVPFEREPLTDGAISAARNAVQAGAITDQVWPGKQTEVTSEFVKDAPESDSGKVHFTIRPK